MRLALEPSVALFILELHGEALPRQRLFANTGLLAHGLNALAERRTVALALG